MDWKLIAEAKRILDKEEGTIYKDWGGKLAVALIYPNIYYVGMSNLGLQTVYHLFNQQADVVSERVFYRGRGARDEGGELISLESQRPLDDFSVLAFSISFEMDYFNVVEILRQAGIPPIAEERNESHPLLIAGGSAVTANPEPLALILDAFVIGEGEVVIPLLVQALRENIGKTKEGLLKALARVPGVYVPSQIPDPSIVHPVKRQWVRNLDEYPVASVVLTEDTEFGDMYLIEVSRGCGRGCRFCLASYTYLPLREHSPELLLAQAREGLRHRHKIGLVGAAVSDYSRIDELAAGLRDMGVGLSASSLRIDSLSESLARALAESGNETLTLAPEAGSSRLRAFINKSISDEAIMAAAHLAARYDFPQLKLYFMLGLPSETEEDVQAIIDLVTAIRRRFPNRVTVNITPFVPKAHTPFQRVAMCPADIIAERLAYIEKRLWPEGVTIKADSPAWAEVQGVLSRGNRDIGKVIAKMKGRSLAAWRRALRGCGLRANDHLRERSLVEALPWSVVSMRS